ncbi:MAG: class 1 fructose-bisphosphatase [Hyphomicrobiaceae bacterium]|nr:class 1 fructose-bisphosphatase [Hyphomicrobiaceae bacterium]
MSISLQDYLNRWAGDQIDRVNIARTVMAIADATMAIADIVSHGALGGDDLGATRGGANADGDLQKELDVRTDEIIQDRLSKAPVAAYASEENDGVLPMVKGAPLLVAVDPLDGSSNIDTNVSIGTIFSVLPVKAGVDPTAPESFMRAGREQVAAGYSIYGPQTSLVVTVGDGTAIFTFDRNRHTYIQVKARASVPPQAREFAINMSNHRHWEEPIRRYIDDLLDGHEGPNKVSYNMRWVGSMVADAHRILIRGGIFLYPGDRRKGYQHGRLRLIYEGNPIAFVMEQAGAGASDGMTRILDIEPTALHQRTPLVFGSAEKVKKVATYVGAH